MIAKISKQEILTHFIGSALQVVAYSLGAASLPFPAFVIAFIVNGAGIAIQVRSRINRRNEDSPLPLLLYKDAQANGFVANIKENPEAKMGLLHAAYGKAPL